MTDFWYNLSAVESDSVLELMQWTNNNLFFHLFGTFILIVLFVIIFRAFVSYNNNPKVSLMYSSFFIGILSIMFKLLSLANDEIVFIAWGLFAITIILQFMMD